MESGIYLFDKLLQMVPVALHGLSCNILLQSSLLNLLCIYILV